MKSIKGKVFLIVLKATINSQQYDASLPVPVVLGVYKEPSTVGRMEWKTSPTLSSLD